MSEMLVKNEMMAMQLLAMDVMKVVRLRLAGSELEVQQVLQTLAHRCLEEMA